MSGIHISATPTSGVNDRLLNLLDLLGQKGYKIAGTGLLEAIKDHLVKRDAVPNKNQWPKTHFHDRARKQTFLTTTPTDATVHIALVGFGTFVTGKPDVIKPVNAKFLTIPARPEAYGKRAREFSDLIFAIVDDFYGRPRPALIRASQTVFKFGKKTKGKRMVKDVEEVGGEVYFWLAKSVRPKPHPEALPKTEDMKRAAVAELESYASTL